MKKEKETVKKSTNAIARYRKAIVRLIVGLIVSVLLALAVVWMINLMTKEEESITLEDSMSVIEEVRPKGEIYVCSSVIEDYAVKREKETYMMFITKEHVCVQTMVQKCSYVVDLDKVEYEATDSTKKVRVKMPKPEYVASTQSSPFMSDDSNYWAKKLASTNAMKQEVEEKIRRTFDTEENRRKAERYAEDAVGEVLKQLGFEVEFVRTIETKKE